jgi:hypothetical protein
VALQGRPIGGQLSDDSVPAPTTQAVNLPPGTPDKGPARVPSGFLAVRGQPIPGLFKGYAPIEPLVCTPWSRSCSKRSSAYG